MPGTVLLLAGGASPSPHVRRALPPAAMCIAADSGIDHARDLGVAPDLVVGDFDSVTPDGLAWAADVGATIDCHPAAKDQTDLELGLAAALATDPDRVVVAAIGGGRFDHLMANILTLGDPRFASAAIDAMVGTALVSIIHDERQLVGRPDELVSLLPLNGDADGVTTTGLGYPLTGETLRSGSSRGVSNYFAATTATVTLDSGTLAAIQPDRLADPDRPEPPTP